MEITLNAFCQIPTRCESVQAFPIVSSFRVAELPHATRLWRIPPNCRSRRHFRFTHHKPPQPPAHPEYRSHPAISYGIPSQSAHIWPRSVSVAEKHRSSSFFIRRVLNRWCCALRFSPKSQGPPPLPPRQFFLSEGCVDALFVRRNSPHRDPPAGP